MGGDVALINLAIDLTKIAREERCRIVALVEAFEVHADVNSRYTVEFIVVRLHELLQAGSCIIVVAGCIDES